MDLFEQYDAAAAARRMALTLEVFDREHTADEARKAIAGLKHEVRTLVCVLGGPDSGDSGPRPAPAPVTDTPLPLDL